MAGTTGIPPSELWDCDLEIWNAILKQIRTDRKRGRRA